MEKKMLRKLYDEQIKISDDYRNIIKSTSVKINDILDKNKVEMKTLLKVIQDKDSSPDEINRCLVARRFVKSNYDELLNVKNNLFI